MGAALAYMQIQDENGSMSLPMEGGTRLTENLVGAAFGDYDSYLVLFHFKGHAMAGFGGAIKNISISLGSSEGKSWIHTGGSSRTSFMGGDHIGILASNDPVSLDQACIDLASHAEGNESLMNRIFDWNGCMQRMR